MNTLALKALRASKSHNQKEIAKILDMSTKTFCIFENSTICKFLPEHIEKLATLYDLSLDEVNYIFFDNKLPNGKNVRAVCVR